MADFPGLTIWTDAYIGDTQHLTLQEHGAYLKLLMIAWRSPGCCLPDDDKRLAVMLGITLRVWTKLKPAVMDFWDLEDGVYLQGRLTREREKVEEQSRKGASAARRRWEIERAKDGAKNRKVASRAKKVDPQKNSSDQSREESETDNPLENNNMGYADASSGHMPAGCSPSPSPSPYKSPADSIGNPDTSPLFKDQRKKAAPKPKADPAFDRLKGAGGASDEAVTAYLAYRKQTKAKGTTERAAGMIAKELGIIADRGGDPDEALDLAQLHGWQGLRADWYFNKKGKDNGNGYSGQGASNGAGMGRGSKASEIADRAARYAHSRAAGGGIDRDPRGGQRED